MFFIQKSVWPPLQLHIEWVCKENKWNFCFIKMFHMQINWNYVGHSFSLYKMNKKRSKNELCAITRVSLCLLFALISIRFSDLKIKNLNMQRSILWWGLNNYLTNVYKILWVLPIHKKKKRLTTKFNKKWW